MAFWRGGGWAGARRWQRRPVLGPSESCTAVSITPLGSCSGGVLAERTAAATGSCLTYWRSQESSAPSASRVLCHQLCLTLGEGKKQAWEEVALHPPLSTKPAGYWPGGSGTGGPPTAAAERHCCWMCADWTTPSYLTVSGGRAGKVWRTGALERLLEFLALDWEATQTWHVLSLWTKTSWPGPVLLSWPSGPAGETQEGSLALLAWGPTRCNAPPCATPLSWLHGPSDSLPGLVCWLLCWCSHHISRHIHPLTGNLSLTGLSTWGQAMLG